MRQSLCDLKTLHKLAKSKRVAQSLTLTWLHSSSCQNPSSPSHDLTVFSPIVSVNKPGNNKIGTVGLPIPNAQVKIAEDGEILIKGSGLMKGYYSRGSAPQLDLEKGWFRTGDLGELDNEGFLKIIGRKKEVIVLSTGKNVSPRSIESQLTLGVT